MNIIDAVIIIGLIVGAISGFKQGVIKKTVGFAGIIVIVILSFVLKNYLSVIMYENLPFLNFWNFLKGIEVLNIFFYEILAFIIVMAVLSLALRIILGITGIIEGVLKATIILAIPSKILGMIVGVLESLVITYVILFVATQPIWNIKEFKDSKLTNDILTKTPIISGYANKTLESYNEIYAAMDSYDENNRVETNEKILDIMLKNKIVSVESADKLIENKKIEIKDKSVIDKYRK